MNPTLLVEQALEAIQYRVYPDTPLSEVIDLMVRRGVRALPIVGESYEVLGIITAGDALREVVSDGRAEESAGASGTEPLRARDVMTRAVLCVSETQPLVDAARMMASRKVQQLPVVREGELIGLVTREGILRAFHKQSAEQAEKRDEES
jgi:CBS domain-containing protein